MRNPWGCTSQVYRETRAASVPSGLNNSPVVRSPRRSSPGSRSRGAKRLGPCRLDADLGPGIDHRLLFRAICPEEIASSTHAAIRGSLEVRSGGEPLGERLVPDFPGLFPREAADGAGCEEKGVIGNSGIDMHATVVVAGVQVVAHVLGDRK